LRNVSFGVDTRCRSLGLVLSLSHSYAKKNCLWGCAVNWVRKLTHEINNLTKKKKRKKKVIYNPDGFLEQLTTRPHKTTFLEELTWTEK